MDASRDVTTDATRIRSLFALVAMIAGIALGGCWDADPDEEGGPLTIESDARSGDVLPDVEIPDDVDPRRPPSLNAPTALALPATPPGESSSVDFEIENTGGRPLEIASVQLEESGDSLRELGLEVDWPSGRTLMPSGTGASSATATLQYEPSNEQPDSGTIVITANDPNLEGGTHTISIETAEPQPRLVVPDRIRFGRLPPNETYRQSFRLHNGGSADLEIDSMRLEGDTDFTVSLFDVASGSEPGTGPGERENFWPADGVPETLAPGEEIGVRVWFQPEDEQSAQGALRIESNDAERSPTTVELSGNRTTPCLSVSAAPELDFGTTSVDRTKARTLLLSACGETPVEVETIEIADGAGGVFSLDTATVPSLPTEIKPGDSLDVVVEFEPDTEQAYKGELHVESDDPARQSYDLALTGAGGTSNTCPTAKANARIKGTSSWKSSVQTVPLETIEFSPTGSNDPDGSVQSYNWSILDRPQDSTARLTPSSSAKEPELFLDLAGRYLVELIVRDDQGMASCGKRALVEIVAAPSSDLHIQLVWDTPNDSDQTDDDGADLDLHYLSPRATAWNEAPWDIFWHNKTANWGDQSSSKDDPTMDIDDTDGAGPENISHPNPVAGQTYSIGVYYYDDHGFGPSFATVRIFHQGQLVEEYKNKYLSGTFEFWKVAVFDAGANKVYKRDEKTNGFPGN